MRAVKFATVLGFAACLATAALPAWAKDWTTIRVGVDATYPPFESVEASGKITGFEMTTCRSCAPR